MLVSRRGVLTRGHAGRRRYLKPRIIAYYGSNHYRGRLGVVPGHYYLPGHGFGFRTGLRRFVTEAGRAFCGGISRRDELRPEPGRTNRGLAHRSGPPKEDCRRLHGGDGLAEWAVRGAVKKNGIRSLRQIGQVDGGERDPATLFRVIGPLARLAVDTVLVLATAYATALRARTAEIRASITPAFIVLGLGHAKRL